MAPVILWVISPDPGWSDLGLEGLKATGAEGLSMYPQFQSHSFCVVDDTHSGWNCDPKFEGDVLTLCFGVWLWRPDLLEDD